MADLSRPDIEALIQARNFKELRRTLAGWTAPEVAELIDELPPGDDMVVFRILPRELATDTFEYLSREKQQELIEALASKQHRLAELLNDLAPDERTALLEELPGAVTQRLLGMLSPQEREVTVKLLGYPEESIGRLMTTDYVRVRPNWTVQQALAHIRRYGQDSETLNVIYVVDGAGRLIDDLRIRQLLLADPQSHIAELMDGRFVALQASDDQETAVQVFRDYDRVALPVTDTQGMLLGIVTVDDVLDVAAEEATEDIQKIGGSDALDEPYMSTPFGTLLRKRAPWLVLLLLGQMITASAMGYFEDEIARAVVLALFVPLIISSGGNSGSQATTLIIRAMAVNEITLSDWWRVMRREILVGLVLGAILAVIAALRVFAWEHSFGAYGEHWFLLLLTVAIALAGVVILGTVSGSMLPFIMRRLGADPATSSAPFVATLVDVTGVVIYFSVALLILRGTLL